jgi:hypothetical protein
MATRLKQGSNTHPHIGTHHSLTSCGAIRSATDGAMTSSSECIGSGPFCERRRMVLRKLRHDVVATFSCCCGGRIMESMEGG